jgi:polysaccharide biosynthesis protein PslH
VCDFLMPAPSIPLSNARGSGSPSASSAPNPRRTGAATVLFEHNVECMLWERQYKNQKNPVKRAYFYGQYVKMRLLEKKMCLAFDAVAAVSTNDADAIRDAFGVTDVFAVPTGVDVDFFSPLSDPPRRGSPPKPPREKFDLVFTGSMDWMPNEDAMIFLAESILPRIVESIPEVKVTVVGRNPTPKLKALAEREPRIHLTGRVDDVRPYIDRSAVYIVPIRVGGGTRIKIYEAMGMARAVVSTTIGAEGLPVVDGEEIILADEPERFAAEVVRLLRDDGARAKIEERARKAVVERFGWDKATEALVRIMERALEKRGRHGPIVTGYQR